MLLTHSQHQISQAILEVDALAMVDLVSDKQTSRPPFHVFTENLVLGGSFMQLLFLGDQ